jgi:hypothetical protein
LSKADSRREHCSPKTVILGCARNFASVWAQLQLELKETSQRHFLDPSESYSSQILDATSESHSHSRR